MPPIDSSFFFASAKSRGVSGSPAKSKLRGTPKRNDASNASEPSTSRENGSASSKTPTTSATTAASAVSLVKTETQSSDRHAGTTPRLLKSRVSASSRSVPGTPQAPGRNPRYQSLTKTRRGLLQPPTRCRRLTRLAGIPRQSRFEELHTASVCRPSPSRIDRDSLLRWEWLRPCTKVSPLPHRVPGHRKIQDRLRSSAILRRRCCP